MATVPVTPLKCTALTTVKGPSSTGYFGNWGGSGPVAPHFTVSVVLYKTATFFAVAKKNLGIGFPGPAKKVVGIGSLAYESSSGHLTVINFVVGRYICNINMRTSQPLKSVAPFNTLAKAVAAKI